VERLLASLEAAPEGCVVTLEGRGDSFCRGLSPEALAQPGRDAATELVRFGRLLHAVDTAPGPVVALVNGPAMGGGLGLAAAADLVLAAPDARFGLPEVMLGLVPAMVFPLVARRMGVVRARALALGAATLSAAEARTVGLVDVVTEHLEETLEGVPAPVPSHGPSRHGGGEGAGGRVPGGAGRLPGRGRRELCPPAPQRRDARPPPAFRGRRRALGRGGRPVNLAGRPVNLPDG
jgi:enoyl-CoA hydratase/carnithine racemase